MCRSSSLAFPVLWATAWAYEAPCGSPGAGDQANTIPLSLDSHELHLNRITNRFEAFSKRIHSIVSSNKADETNLLVLNNALDITLGNSCGPDQFQCGGTHLRCISNLLVCDGTAECVHGEDEACCDVPFVASDIFVGDVMFDKCSQFIPGHITLVINSVAKIPFFSSRYKIGVFAIMEGECEFAHHAGALISSGHYTLPNRQLYFEPPEEDRLGLLCPFDGGHTGSCQGYMIREGTGDRCTPSSSNHSHRWASSKD